jgi:hypothetical protein
VDHHCGPPRFFERLRGGSALICESFLECDWGTWSRTHTRNAKLNRSASSAFFQAAMVVRRTVDHTYGPLQAGGARKILYLTDGKTARERCRLPQTSVTFHPQFVSIPPNQCFFSFAKCFLMPKQVFLNGGSNVGRSRKNLPQLFFWSARRVLTTLPP